MLCITKRFKFEAAHVLPKHPGKCARLHGHSYILEVAVSGEYVEDPGYFMDFDTLKEIVVDRVVDVLDHRFINEVFTSLNVPGETTAENISQWIWERISPNITMCGATLERVQLWETANCSVTLSRGGKAGVTT